MCTHRVSLSFPELCVPVAEIQKIVCGSQSQWFPELRTTFKTSRHHCKFKTRQQRPGFSHRNELNGIA